jgi:hypothetical protein
MMSSSKKKVHYERGTKGGKSHHSHRSSRDSGVGSSSASDRASLGTAPEHDPPFSYQQIEDQRLNLSAVQEALDAANERIKKLEATTEKLNGLLADSNKENRSLKKERHDLLDQIDELNADLDDEKRLNRREASPRTGAATPSGSRTERRTTPPRREADPRQSHRVDEGSQGSRVERRISWKEIPVSLYNDRALPSAPQPPPNPFMPNSTRPPSVSYPATTVTYAPATVSYAPAPVFGIAPPAAAAAPRSTNGYPNDGRYHPYPL